MSKELLVSYIPFTVTKTMIDESIKKNDGRLIVNGPLQRADAQNQNGRVYPKSILEREAVKYQSLIKERRALGELDHPDSSVVNLSNVSHNVVEMHWDGNGLMGTVEILATPAGNILKELFKNGIKLGISSRGLGSTQETQNGLEVQEDFDLIAFDFVSNPSTHGAFLSPLHEGIGLNAQRSKYNQVNRIITDILIDMK